MYNFLFSSWLLLFSQVAVGASIVTISNDVSGVIGIVIKLMWAACIIVGIILISAAFAQYKEHRNNPKMVPLTTPLLYITLGLVAITIPFANKILKLQDSYSGQRGTQYTSEAARLDAPLVQTKKQNPNPNPNPNVNNNKK